MKKLLIPILAVLLLVSYFIFKKDKVEEQAAVEPASDGKVELAENQILNLDITTNPPTLDPTQAYDGASTGVINSIFEALVIQNPKTLEYVPATAESWTVSKDNKVYTFKIRKDAKWSDGKALTAHDFVYAWRRIVDPNLASPFASYLDASLNILNAGKIIQGEAPLDSLGVKALDDHTLEVTLSIATPWFIEAAAYSSLAPVRKDIIEKYGDQWTQAGKIVSNGAFVLTEYVPNEKIILRKNPHYHGANDVILEGANYTIIANVEQRFNRYRAGDTDAIGIPRSKYKSIMASGEKVYHAKSSVVFGIVLNINNPKLADVRVRKAIAYALDPKLLVERVIGLGYIPTTTWVRPDSKDGQAVENAEWFYWTADKRKAEAIKLLNEAGYNKDNKLKIEFLYNTSEFWKPIFIAYQDLIKTNLNGIVEANLATQEWKVYLNTVKHGKHEIGQKGWELDFDNAINYLGIFRSTDEDNKSGFSNAKFDALYEQFLVSAPEDRPNLIKEMDRILTQEEVAVIPIFFTVGNSLRNPKLIGWSAHASNNYIKDYYFIK